jgi:hypothetical protein
MTLPEWQALHREGLLVHGLLCSAANSISRAGYADKLGEYYTAFFGFSLGLERLAKLCVVTDFALKNDGKLPPPKLLSDHTTESGEHMSDIESASYRTAQIAVVQRYGRYYTLLIVRWLASAFKVLALRASLEEGMIAFFGHWELFYTFTTEDRFLRDRRNWPLR